MEYIDIHSHLDSEEYDEDRDEVLARMKEAGVGTITVAANLEESKKAVDIAGANDNVWACVGVHPENIPKPPLDVVGRWSDGGIEELLELAKCPKVVGIGECGLDYFRLEYSMAPDIREKQIRSFENQIQVALKVDKPLMLHIREAHLHEPLRAYDDALSILKNYKDEAGDKLRGNVHFFAGDKKIAQKFLDLGFTLSFTGVITFTTDYNEAVKYIPQNMIMSETDAPWVAPVPFRGKRNEPTYVIEVVKKLAQIRGEEVEDLNRAILQNAKRVFGVN